LTGFDLTNLHGQSYLPYMFISLAQQPDSDMARGQNNDPSPRLKRLTPSERYPLVI
jgi:hypothetical protein